MWICIALIRNNLAFKALRYDTCLDHRCKKRAEKNKKTLKNVKNVIKIKNV